MMAIVVRWAAGFAFAALAVGLLLADAAHAQSAAGTWHGTLAMRTGPLRLSVKLAPAAGGLEGAVLSPEQSAEYRPLDEVKQSGAHLSFSYPPTRGRFDGEWDAARGAWVGNWTTPVGDIPLVLEKGDIPKGPVVAGLDGDWEGALTLAQARLRLVLRVKTGPYGTVALLDSPDQLAMGMPLTSLTRDGDKVAFAYVQIHARFDGVLSSDGQSIVGEFLQGKPLPLTLTKRTTARVVRRPQTPAKPYPYREEEVAFDSAPGVRLAGTLTLPAGPGPFPAAVLITGSGAQDRDETILGHKPFLVLADDLTRRGVAVLRYDDRGFARSTGDFAKATTEDFAVDAAAAAAFLRGRSDIDPKRVGLIGHSEGGIVAPMVAAKEPKTAFVVLMAGVGAPAEAAMAAQRAALTPYFGGSPERARQNELLVEHVLAATKDAKDSTEAEARATVVLLREGGPLGIKSDNVQPMARQLASDWTRKLMAYDPAPTLRAVRAPILAVNGTKDLQVIADLNLAGIRAATKDNPDVSIVPLPGLNHMFQTAGTGAIGEYADIEETIAPIAPKTIGDWVVAHTRP
ncbi:S9 family peptidase [Phenylobacterium sp.]|uniref:alpha/beta hydrolase family protein n=1 Tax=Phenylobacterium sp. TaxID=1871053 RepID=UPI0025DE6633|nr:alpha/beta hydrolase [Phenylobacterium sp.]